MSTEIFTNFQKYLNALGYFWQSFNSLELFLRLYLNNKNGKDNSYAMKFNSLPTGFECEENAMTDRKTFGQLCHSFNQYQNVDKKIDFTEILKLRDAMAHGRVTSDYEAKSISVIKYSKPINGKVIVEYSRIISSEELEKIACEISDLGREISIRGGAKVI